MQRRHSVLPAAVIAFVAFVSAQPAGTMVRLTLTEGTSMAAALSPDARTIVIDLLGALWTLSADGGRATRILEDGYDARLPAWSPDGQRIAFQAYRSTTWNIWTIGRDGTGVRQETSGPFDDREPHWSPDGQYVAFASDRSGNYDVWILALASGELRQLTRNPANDFMPAWSPDGREIAFISDRRVRGVYAAAVRSGAERLVRAEAANAASPSWSPDGKTVSYAAIDSAAARLMVGGNNIAEASEDVFPFRAQWPTPNELLYTADGKIKSRPRSGGAARTIEFSAVVEFARSAFTPRRQEPPGEWRRPARGVMHPAISPDGTQIVFAALGDLWLMPATSAYVTPRALTNDAFVDTDPAWSPDGTRIAFSTDRDGTMDLWVLELESGATRKLVARGMSSAWSGDGTRIAFLDPESQLQIVDVASGQVRKVHDRLNEPGRPSWSPDGRAIVMSALRPYSTRFREGSIRCCACRWTAALIAGSIRCRTNRLACAETPAPSGRRTGRKWPRSSTGISPHLPSRAMARRLARHAACRGNWPTHHRGRAIRATCCIRLRPSCGSST
jgi:Tol biopolymer transport system component